jgi:hypothetical protein
MNYGLIKTDDLLPSKMFQCCRFSYKDYWADKYCFVQSLNVLFGVRRLPDPTLTTTPIIDTRYSSEEMLSIVFLCCPLLASE